jgi:hypothetical protein
MHGHRIEHQHWRQSSCLAVWPARIVSRLRWLAVLVVCGMSGCGAAHHARALAAVAQRRSIAGQAVDPAVFAPGACAALRRPLAIGT